FSQKEQLETAQEMLDLVDLKGCATRKIQELSGGQRQRVGLARALAIKPDLFLLDEPLSNIDQVTKLEVATHLKNLFAKLDIPVILVTHNHEDALFLSEQLAILIDGKIEQIGHVKEIMQHPKTPFIKRLLMPFNTNGGDTKS
ncbi:MAG TPA: ATP-binding cassette domain-containing protein, partial [Bacteroidia bacterium]|nr:ATP-binding cassette domain-containing protein [Bacteroidia bacterium]